MRRCFLAAGVFAILGLVIFPIISCGGGGSSQSLPASSPPPPPPTTSGGSTPPSGAIVIENIEDNPWLTCGACGNGGGTGSAAQYSATNGTVSPSEDGSSTQFAIAATVPFTNAYFFQVHDPIHAQIGFLSYEFDLFIPNGFEAAPQAIEFECQQKLNGWIYNFSWQANYPANTWRIFNYGANRWDDTGIAFTHFSPGSWHHIVAEFHNDVSTNSVWHDALTVDGVRTTVNIRHDAFLAGGDDQFSNAVQLDSNILPAAYSIFVDRMKVTYK